MTPADISRILAKAAAFDQRTVGQADILAWLDAIGDLDVDDALAAVTRHYRDSTEFLRPAQLRAQADEIDRDRRRRARERAEAEEVQRAIDAGPPRDRSEEVTALVRQVMASLPGDPSDRIHERAVLRARKQRGRPEPLKPRGRAKPPKDWPPPQDDSIAALARRYLADGHAPAVVAERLAVSKRWCQRALDRFRRPSDPVPNQEDPPPDQPKHATQETPHA